MSKPPALTRYDRAQRHQAIVAAYRGGLSSRAVAAGFALSDGHARAIMRLYEAARPCGRQAIEKPPRALKPRHNIRDARGRFA